MGRGFQGGWLTPLGLAAGSLAALLFPVVPPVYLVAAAALGGVLLLAGRYRQLGFPVLSCCWSLWCFHQALGDRLDPSLSGDTVELDGTITSVPEAYPGYVRFRFQPDKTGLPESLQVYWYQEWPELSSGQRWRLELKLKPPWGNVNFWGADRERWLFANGIGGLATARQGTLLATGRGHGFSINSIREALQTGIAESIEDERQRGVIQALAIAERAGLSATVRTTLFLTGTSHLLAISGLHVGLAAVAGIWLGRLLFWVVPLPSGGRVIFLVALGTGLLTAVLYAALAGFGVSTQRALLMLVAACTVVALGRSMQPSKAWLLALAGVLLIDPFAPLGAGFWFSFMAVAALIVQFVPRAEYVPHWKSLLLAQAAVVLVLLPVSAAWFQAFSPIGVLANLVAIPWVSILVVPLVLVGTGLFFIAPVLASLCWSLAGVSAGILLRLLDLMAAVQGELVPVNAPGLLALTLALLGGFILLLPRELPGRRLGVFMLAPLLLPLQNTVPEGGLVVDVLDAGQGTAAIIQTGARQLVYDTGPGDGADHNLVRSVVVPALSQGPGRKPDRIIVSHADLDHAGGLRTLLDLFPSALYQVNHPDHPLGGGGCEFPDTWQWDGVRFRVLHPAAGLPYRGNDSSCVLSIRAGRASLLLAGDISASAENRLVLDGLDPHRLLLVPHHGSDTSSSPPFIDSVRPEMAIATAALGNRFGFPRQEVVSRYRNAGARFWSTGLCGGLRVTLHPQGGIEVFSARRHQPRLWRRPAGDRCP